MFTWFKLSLHRQIILLALVGFLCAAASFSFSIYPPLYFRLRHFLAGLTGAAGALVIAAVWAFVLQKKRLPLITHDGLTKMSRLTIAGAVVSTAAGEEVLFSGLLFGSLAGEHIYLAFCLTAAASFLGYFGGRATMPFASLKSLQAVVYAATFWIGGSLAASAIAHGLSELVLLVVIQRNFKIVKPFAFLHR